MTRLTFFPTDNSQMRSLPSSAISPVKTSAGGGATPSASVSARERNRDYLDLFGLASGASYDLKVAAYAFDRASAPGGDARDVPHALVTLRAVARVLTEAVAEYERTLIPFPQTVEG